MSQDQTNTPLTRLTGRDREIAVQAIAALAQGTPVEAAYQILAGIEALDAGPDAPMVMLWPKSNGYETLEDQAAWHEAERDRLLDRLAAFKQAFPSWSRNDPTAPTSSQPSHSASHHSEPLPSLHQASASQEVLSEVPDKDQQQSSRAPSPVSSDACASNGDEPV